MGPVLKILLRFREAFWPGWLTNLCCGTGPVTLYWPALDDGNGHTPAVLAPGDTATTVVVTSLSCDGGIGDSHYHDIEATIGNAKKAIARLEGKKRVRVTSPAGTDVTVSIERRPALEVATLIELLRAYIASDAARLVREGIRLVMLGRRDRLPTDLTKEIASYEAASAASAMAERAE